MKKYRITSIPESLPKAKKGKTVKLKRNRNKDSKKRRYRPGRFKDKKGNFNLEQSDQESNNSMINYTSPSPETEVQLNIPQQDYTWNTGTDIYRPGYFNELYSKEYTETGENEDCPYGYKFYKGECIPNEEYWKLDFRASDEKWEESEKRWDALMKKSQDRIEELRANNENYRLRRYQTAFDDSKKKDKIEPQYIVPKNSLVGGQNPVFNEDGSIKTDENGTPITESNLEAAKRTHYVQTNEDGTYSFYPKDIMYDRIINNGFFNNEFEQYWGLDPKQVEEQLGDVQQQARESYDATMLNKIYEKSLKEGKDVNTVISELPKSLGYTDAMTTQFQPRLSEEIQNQYNELTKNLMEGYDAAELERDKYDLDEDFDFSNVSGTSMVGDNKVWMIVNDLDGKFTRHWINEGETKEEKQKRAKEVKQIREDYDKNDPATLEAYRKASESWDQQWKDFGEKAQEINNTVGYDAFYDMDYKRLSDRIGMEQGNWAQTLKNERKENVRNALMDRTGQGEEFGRYMDDIAGVAEEKRKLIEESYNSGEINEGTKAALLGNLKRHLEDPENVPFTFDLPGGSTLGEVTGLDPALQALYSPEAYKNYLWDLPEYANMKDGQGLYDKGDMSWYNYLWDVVTNPGDAIGYAIDPRKEMWDPKYKGISYNQRKEGERLGYGYEQPDGNFATGHDNYSYKDFITNPAGRYMPGVSGLGGTGAVLKFFNTINPLNIGDELYRADDKWSRAGELGLDAVLDLATLASFGSSQALKAGVKGTQALNAYNKASKLKSVLSGLNKINPITKMAQQTGVVGSMGRYGQRFGQNFTKYGTPVFAYEAVRPGGYLPNAVTDFSQGNVGSGLENLTWGALSASPYARYIKPTIGTAQGIGQGIKSGNLVLQNPASKYSFTMGNPTTGKGFFYGNPSAIQQGSPLFPKTNRFMYDKTNNLFDVRKIKADFNEGGMVMELDENQIAEYAKNGYIIEDV